MAYLNIANFKWGLDTRRSELTSIPGTLETCNNGHVNQGSEVEKRKAWVPYGNTAVGGTLTVATLPSGGGYCFGAEPGISTIFTFGSALASSIPALPAGFTYVRCLPPISGGMTGVLWSSTYAGLPLCIATFSDLNPPPNTQVFLFYNGTAVYDFVTGIILETGLTLANVANDFYLLNFPTSTGFTASWTATNAYVDVTSPVGSTFATNIVKNSAAGGITQTVEQSGIPPIAATQGVAKFQIMGGSYSAGTNKITFVKVNGTDILNGSVNFASTGSSADTATAVATQINTYTGTSGYTAYASNNSVILSTTGADPDASNTYVVEVDAAGNVCIGDCLINFAGADQGTELTSIMVNSQEILGTTIGPVSSFTPAANKTLTYLISQVAIQINSGTGSSGFLAYASGTTLRISKSATTSIDSPLNVIITGSATGTTTSASQLNNQPLNVVLPSQAVAMYSGQLIVQSDNFTYGQTLNFTGIVQAIVSGGVPPYSYSWVRTQVGNNFNLTNTNTLNLSFNKNVTIYSGIYGGVDPSQVPDIVQVVIVDSVGETFTSSPVRLLIAT